MSDVVTMERHDAVSIAHIDDGKANALSFEVISRLQAAVDAAAADPEIGALVIDGRPGCFSGGFDLGVMRGGDADEITRLVADGGHLVRSCYGAGVPVVAACTGHAVAAGALLLLGCDARIGPDADVRIGLPEVAISMVLPAWAIEIAADRLARTHLQAAAATATMYAPAEARAAGYLDEVVAPDSVLERAVEVAAGLASSLDGSAYAGTVALLRGEVIARMDRAVETMRAAVSSSR